MYGTIMCFDERTEEKITHVWSGLAAANISTYHIDKNGRQKRPHITLADYQGLNIDKYASRFNAFFAGKEAFEVDLSILGSFPNGGTLFVTSVMTQKLYQFHRDYHQTMAAFNDDEESYYSPDRWVPHCTLANHLAPNQLTEAFDFVSHTFQPLKARIREIVLIKLVMENGSVFGSESVLSHRF